MKRLFFTLLLMVLANNSLRAAAPTPHWTPILEKGIYPLRGQRLKYYESTARFQVVAAGRRSLKTVIGKRKLVEAYVEASIVNSYIKKLHGEEGFADLDLEWNDLQNILRFIKHVDESDLLKTTKFGRYIYAGPTRDQVERIAWEDFQRMIPQRYIKRVWESDLCIESKFGQELWCVGLDRPARIEGSPIDGMFIDEFPDIPEGAWEANIRPALSDTKGWAIIAGVPDRDKPNNKKFKEMRDTALSGENPDYEFFEWDSEDVLPDDEIMKVRGELSEDMYDQEYRAKFLNAPGGAYPAFSRTSHIKETPYDPLLNVIVSCDFNVGHHNWGIYQADANKEWRAIDQVYLQNAMVDDMVKELKEIKLAPLLNIKSKLLGRPATLADLNITFYGDYAGQNRTAFATYSGWRQIRNAFQDAQGNSIAEFQYRPAPPIGDRLNKVNGKLRSADGIIHLRIDPKCTELIIDLEEVTRKMLFSQQKDGKRTHASDALGYAICQHDR